MIKNYLKIALRNLLRFKLYSLINILGLAISIAACLLILQYASFELSYDQFHKNANNLYRLTNDRYQNGKLIQHGVITYPSVPKAMKTDYPEVVNYTRAIMLEPLKLQYNELSFDEGVLFVDSAFLSMFSFPLIEGNAATALAAPYSILLSEASAEKYFGSHWREQEIIGKQLNVDNRTNYLITGVFKNLPKNTHMQFDFLASYKTLGVIYNKEFEDSWTNSNFYVYLQLQPNTDKNALEQKFVDFSKRHFHGTEISNSIERFYLQPVKDIHLYSDYEYEMWINGNGSAVWALLIIAGFILIIAWINYINLTTARANERAGEVGVRKVVGARKSQLIMQFLIESFLFSTIGIAIAVVFVELFRSLLARQMDIQLSSSFFTSNLTLIFVPLFLLGTMVSALYPGTIISAFNMNSILKGKLTRSARGQLLRKGLVVFQFVMSFILITGTYVIYQQTRFMMNGKLGMNIDQMLVVEGPRLTDWDSTYFNNIESIKTELKHLPAIVNITASVRVPGNRTGRIFNVKRKDGNSEQSWTTSDIGVDYEYFKTFEMPILAGRGFKRSDHNFNFNNIRYVVLNQTAVKLLGFNSNEAALHKVINYWDKDWEIVGVVADHHQQSLHVPVEPIIFMPLYSTNNAFFIKIKTQNLDKTIATIKETYLDFYPGNSFNYFFLDDYFNQQYQSDERFGTAFGMFASFGVLLACLGLFGLSFFTTAQRTKEIGVRKILGASTESIVGLLSKDYTRLVLLAMILATPLTYLGINKWLLGYAYRINISVNLFLIPALIVFVVALLTVGFQTIRAATANPVESIRYE